MNKKGLLCLSLLLGAAVSPLRAQAPVRILECGGAFTATASSGTLSEHFGAGVAVSTKIYVGEGFYQDGTVLFGQSSADRLEVLWRDAAGQRSIQSVCVRDASSTWHTPTGIRMGASLKSIERTNGRPFELAGFAWDGGGGTRSWAGGKLDQSAGKCELSLKFEPGSAHLNKPYFEKVLGDRKFSSTNPTMRKINPVVSRMCLVFK